MHSNPHSAADPAAASRPAPAPQRTCVGCRQVTAAAELSRVVADAAGHLHFDTGRRKAPGRGAYVHREPRCLERALAGGFARSFRRKVCAATARSLVGPECKPMEGRAGRPSDDASGDAAGNKVQDCHS